MKNTIQIPKSLGKDGRRLWRSIADEADIQGAQELLFEMCATVDRLSQVRAELKKTGLTIQGAKGTIRNPLLTTEIQLQAQYGRFWKLLGLADPDPGDRRPPGRPVKG